MHVLISIPGLQQLQRITTAAVRGLQMQVNDMLYKPSKRNLAPWWAARALVWENARRVGEPADAPR